MSDQKNQEIYEKVVKELEPKSDALVKLPSWRPGDRILVFQPLIPRGIHPKFHNKWPGLYELVKQSAFSVEVKKLDDGTVRRVHISHVKALLE